MTEEELDAAVRLYDEARVREARVLRGNYMTDRERRQAAHRAGIEALVEARKSSF